MTNKIIEAAHLAGIIFKPMVVDGDEYEYRLVDFDDNIGEDEAGCIERFYAIAYRQALEDAAKVATQIDLESQGVLPIRVALISSRIAKSIRALKEQQHG